MFRQGLYIRLRVYGLLVKRLKDLEKATHRASDLTKQLLTFSKGGTPIKKPEDLSQIIMDSAYFVSRGTNVRVEYDFQEKLP